MKPRTKIKQLSPDMALINWDFAASGIRCRADWIGATVFEFNDNGDRVRILAYNVNDARAAYERADYLEATQPHPTLL